MTARSPAAGSRRPCPHCGEPVGTHAVPVFYDPAHEAWQVGQLDDAGSLVLAPAGVWLGLWWDDDHAGWPRPGGLNVCPGVMAWRSK